MKINEMMNYRFDNPNENINVDTKITEHFYFNKERTPEQQETFNLWLSISRENSIAERIIRTYNENKETSVSIGNQI